MTTLLLRRWMFYYGLLPSLVRLVALQAISGALLQINLHKFFGPEHSMAAWVVASVTTSAFDVLVRWITSNIADQPHGSEGGQSLVAAHSSHAVALVVGGGIGCRTVPVRTKDRHATRALQAAVRARAQVEAAMQHAGAILPRSRPVLSPSGYTRSLTFTGRRVFHWEVALRRNVFSLTCLSFISMWVLLLDAMAAPEP